MQRLSTLPPSVAAYLSEFVVRRRRVAVLRAAGWSLYAFLLWLLLSCAADRLIHLPAWARMLLLGVGVSGSLGIFAWPLRRLRQKIDWVEVATTIEQRTGCFGQRLVTVTSQLLDEPGHRGSDQILAHLAQQVESQAAIERCRRPLPIPGALRPWGLSAIAALLVVGLMRVPVLGMPQLLIRFIEPTVPVAPVTTTSLRVSPGDCDVPVAEPLRVEVEAHRLANDTVWLHHNDDGVHWIRSTMESATDGRYVFTITSIERDVRYFVEAGDATSPFYLVRVKRPPTVSEFRIRYTYPSYTSRAPFTVANNTGLIEAPIGSEALLTVVASEPLQSATLTLNGQNVPMDAAGEENARQIKVPVMRDATYAVQLEGTRDTGQTNIDKLHIRATPDHPPILRLQQAGRILRLNPTTTFPLDYQALDDFGLDALTLRAQVNDASPIDINLDIGSDRRRQEDTLEFDLASLKLKLGDVVTLTMTARDNAGQATSSGSLQVLASPQVVDLDTQARIDELDGAAQLAQMVGEELDPASAGKAQTKRAETGAADDLSAQGAMARHFSSASELASLLRQSLLRAAVHTDATQKMNVALATWMDTAQRLSIIADQLFSAADKSADLSPSQRAALTAVRSDLKTTLDQIVRVARGQRAIVALKDLQNLKAAEAAAGSSGVTGSGKLSQMLEQMHEEVRNDASALGLNADAADFESSLRQQVAAGEAILGQIKPVNFAAAAREWAAQAKRDPLVDTELDSRLLTASAAEAVRPDADLVRARDLEVASRAATNLEIQIQSSRGKPGTIEALLSFADALDVLEVSPTVASPTRPSDENAAAQSARTKIAAMAASAPASPRNKSSTRNTEAQRLAMQANSESVNRNYSRVAELDAALTQTLSAADRASAARGAAGRAHVAAATQRSEDRVAKLERAHRSIVRSMSAAQAADQLARNQSKLEADLQASNTPQAVDAQRSVAQAIAKAEQDHEAALTAATKPSDDDPNWRSRAAETLLKTQEQLSAMPQALAVVQTAATAKRDADARWRDARAQAEKATTEQKEMAERAADQAAQDASEAGDRLTRSLSNLLPGGVEKLATSMEPFDPDAMAARVMLNDSLAPALARLNETAKSGDAMALDGAADDARQSIDAVQSQLARAQDAIMQRDPLMSAKWFARAATDSLSRSPNDLKTARAHQNNVTLALSHAWDRAIHRAAAQRLAMLPSLAPAYAPAAAGQRSGTSSTAQGVALSRQWGQLHPTLDDSLNSTLAAPDPPGYEEDLRLYFQAIDKAQEKAK